MKKSKTLALTMTAVGLILAIAGPFLPGGVHLVPNDPPGVRHVTVLTATPGGEVLAGTESGKIWRLHNGIWTQESLYLGGHPVMAILGEPGRAPIGTAGGLYAAPVGAPAVEERVGSLLQTHAGLLIGTEEGVRLLSNGRWTTPGPKANVYTLLEQKTADDSWVHAGTVGAGVLSSPASTADRAWQPNNLGLPEGVNVFSLVTTPGGLLLAGTSQGLYWQTAPGQTWRSLHPDLLGRRVLALYLQADGQGMKDERLWIGGDDGLGWMELAEQGGSLTAKGTPTAADEPAYQPSVGVSWIISNRGQIMLSAGSVYTYGSTQMPGWYWVSIVGVILILLAAWWMPQPPPPLVQGTAKRQESD